MSEIFVIDNVATDSFQIQGHHSDSGNTVIKITLLDSCNVGTVFSYLRVHRKYEDSLHCGWLQLKIMMSSLNRDFISAGR